MLRPVPIATVLRTCSSITGVNVLTPFRSLCQQSRVSLITVLPSTSPLIARSYTHSCVVGSLSSYCRASDSILSHKRAISTASTSQNSCTVHAPKMPDTPEQIIAKLSQRFDKAKESGDLLFFPSTIQKHEEYGVEVSKSTVIPPDIRKLILPLRAVGDSFMSGSAEQACPAYATFRPYGRSEKSCAWSRWQEV
jgi:hypothetical protein